MQKEKEIIPDGVAPSPEKRRVNRAMHDVGAELDDVVKVYDGASVFHVVEAFADPVFMCVFHLWGSVKYDLPDHGVVADEVCEGLP